MTTITVSTLEQFTQQQTNQLKQMEQRIGIIPEQDYYYESKIDLNDKQKLDDIDSQIDLILKTKENLERFISKIETVEKEMNQKIEEMKKEKERQLDNTKRAINQLIDEGKKIINRNGNSQERANKINSIERHRQRTKQMNLEEEIARLRKENERLKLERTNNEILNRIEQKVDIIPKKDYQQKLNGIEQKVNSIPKKDYEQKLNGIEKKVDYIPKKDYQQQLNGIEIVMNEMRMLKPIKLLKEGKYCIKLTHVENKYVDAPGPNKNDVVHIWNGDGKSNINQKFQFDYLGMGIYRIVACSTNNAIEYFKVNPKESYSRLVQRSLNGGKEQQWRIIPHGDCFLIRNMRTNLVWDICGAKKENGTKVIAFERHNRANQLFKIIPTN